MACAWELGMDGILTVQIGRSTAIFTSCVRTLKREHSPLLYPGQPIPQDGTLYCTQRPQNLSYTFSNLRICGGTLNHKMEGAFLLSSIPWSRNVLRLWRPGVGATTKCTVEVRATTCVGKVRGRFWTPTALNTTALTQLNKMF